MSETEEVWTGFAARFGAFIDMLKQESERGSVIVSAALMDEALEQLLKAKLVPSPEKNDELFYGPYAPLGNFSAKIDFAYRVGIIGVNQRSSMHLIRKLRNDFAHSSRQIGFTSQKVHSRIQKLFDLNKKLLDTVWNVVERENNQHVFEMIGEQELKQGADYLSKIMGWRATFELLCAFVGASFYEALDGIEPLVARNSNSMTQVKTSQVLCNESAALKVE